jgi:hypothetical protein
MQIQKRITFEQSSFLFMTTFLDTNIPDFRYSSTHQCFAVSPTKSDRSIIVVIHFEPQSRLHRETDDAVEVCQERENVFHCHRHAVRVRRIEHAYEQQTSTGVVIPVTIS